MLLTIAPPRGRDAFGSGHFGAPRGGRDHLGCDYACAVGTKVCSLTNGVVTKLGYAYSDDLSYRYVEVTDGGGYKHRYFYVSPMVLVNDRIYRTDVLGTAQDISARYDDNLRKMRNHVHYEILKGRVAVDPE